MMMTVVVIMTLAMWRWCGCWQRLQGGGVDGEETLDYSEAGLIEEGAAGGGGGGVGGGGYGTRRRGRRRREEEEGAVEVV